MGIKISALAPVVTPTLSDVFPIVQAGVTYKESCTQLSDLLATVSVSSITGTANQVIASSPTGDVVLSLPQSIATTSDVTFGSVAFSPTTKGIVGTVTNNSAAAGYVGEYISSTVLQGSSVNIPGTGMTVDITSISLSAGDWDVWGNIWTDPGAGTTTSSISGWINTTSVAAPTAPGNGARVTHPYAVPASFDAGLFVGMARFSLASTTTVYLSGTASFAVSTLDFFGFIGARRVR